MCEARYLVDYSLRGRLDGFHITQVFIGVRDQVWEEVFRPATRRTVPNHIAWTVRVALRQLTLEESR